MLLYEVDKVDKLLPHYDGEYIGKKEDEDCIIVAICRGVIVDIDWYWKADLIVPPIEATQEEILNELLRDETKTVH
jgi:hypothetical protein